MFKLEENVSNNKKEDLVFEILENDEIIKEDDLAYNLITPITTDQKSEKKEKKEEFKPAKEVDLQKNQKEEKIASEPLKVQKSEKVEEQKMEKEEVKLNTNGKSIFKSDDDNLRRTSLFNAESDLYRIKFDEYAGIPDCIVNEIFGLNDGKGKISIEEAIIMLMNLIPTAKSGINEAKTIQDAIYISRIKIAAFLYKECTFGFTNIPEHSRVNLSNKIKSDCDKNKVYDVLYDYQLMRLSGYLPLG